MTALVVIEGIVILLLLVLVAGLLRSHADILRKLEALGAGDDAPPMVRSRGVVASPRHTEPASMSSVTGPTPFGDSAAVALTASRGYVLLAFLSTGCSTCSSFWKAFRNGMDMPRADIRPVIVTKGAHEESPADLRSHATPEITTIMSSEAWDAFRVPGTPYFQLVDTSTGTVVGEGSAGSWPRLVELVERSLGDDRATGVAATTSQRQEDSDEALRRAGIEPGDSSMYGRPS